MTAVRATRESVILMLWRQGHDTQSMAAMLRWSESDVANTLARLRDEAHK